MEHKLKIVDPDEITELVFGMEGGIHVTFATGSTKTLRQWIEDIIEEKLAGKK